MTDPSGAVELMLNARKVGNEAEAVACVEIIRCQTGVKPEYRNELVKAFYYTMAADVREFSLYLQSNKLFSDREIFAFLTIRGKMKPDERAMTDSIIHEMWGDETIQHTILLRIIDARIEANTANKK